MPVSEVQLPDGSVIELQHPENTTEEQILGFARSHWNNQYLLLIKMMLLVLLLAGGYLAA
jgi:hypothetical protein